MLLAFPWQVHIHMFGVDRYLVDVVDRYMVDVVDRHSQRNRFQLGFAFALVLLQIADLSSLLSSSKLMSEMDFERPSSGVHQDLVNALDMAWMDDQYSAALVDRCNNVAGDRFFLVVLDRCVHVVVDRLPLI